MFNFFKKDKYRVRAIMWTKKRGGETCHNKEFKNLEDAQKDFDQTVKDLTYKGWKLKWWSSHTVQIVDPKHKEENSVVELITYART